MTNWYQKEYLCPDCDSFIVITTKSNELRDRNCFECKGELVLISTSTPSEHEKTNKDYKKSANDMAKEWFERERKRANERNINA